MATAKDVVDQVADRRTIAGSREAMRAAPVGKGFGGGPMTGLDGLEHLDGGT